MTTISKLRNKVILLILAIKEAIWMLRNMRKSRVAEIEIGIVGKPESMIRFTPHSFLSAWCSMIRAWMSNQNPQITDTNGVGQYFEADDGYVVDGPAANSAYGIVVGDDDTAVDQDDYQLSSKIAHGSSGGQLEYGSTTFGPLTQNGNVTSFQITRTFNNASGANVIIKECGIYGLNYYSTTHYFMCERTILGTPYTVTNGSTVYVRYTVRITT